MNWQDCMIGPDASVRDAIAAIDSSGARIALVADPDRNLLGSITDGDVRRALLKGIDLDGAATEIMNASPVTGREGDGRTAVLALMRKRRLHQIPLLDDAGRLSGLETVDDLVQGDDNETVVVLMAGGPGTRLHPLTLDTPKPLLEVGNKPLLETTIEQLVAHGFGRMFISVNYLADKVKEQIGTGERWDIDIAYLEEDERRGTAGALALLPEKPALPFLVMNADLLTNLDYRHLLAYHSEHKCPLTICVREHATQVPYGVVDVADHRVVRLEEKPEHRHFINAGIYVLNPELLDRVPDGDAFDMTTLIEQLIAEDQEVAVFPIREFWLDIGHHDDFAAAGSHYERLFS